MNEKDLAIRAVKEGGKVAREKFRGDYDIRRKAKHDFATSVDREAEERILEILDGSPHAIFGEEMGEHPGDEYTWIIDPIDGTTNFMLGNPVFSSAIALVKDDDILLSAFYIPMTDDLFVAEKGEGAYANGERMHVSDVQEVAESFLIFCHGKRPADSERAVDVYSRFKTECNDLRQLGAATVEFTTVASGRAEAFIFPGIPKYDAAPGLLMVQEAGGTVTDFEGNAWDFSRENIVASNGEVHEEVLAMLRE